MSSMTGVVWASASARFCLLVICMLSAVVAFEDQHEEGTVMPMRDLDLTTEGYDTGSHGAARSLLNPVHSEGLHIRRCPHIKNTKIGFGLFLVYVDPPIPHPGSFVQLLIAGGADLSTYHGSTLGIHVRFRGSKSPLVEDYPLPLVTDMMSASAGLRGLAGTSNLSNSMMVPVHMAMAMPFGTSHLNVERMPMATTAASVRTHAGTSVQPYNLSRFDFAFREQLDKNIVKPGTYGLTLQFKKDREVFACYKFAIKVKKLRKVKKAPKVKKASKVVDADTNRGVAMDDSLTSGIRRRLVHGWPDTPIASNLSDQCPGSFTAQVASLCVRRPVSGLDLNDITEAATFCGALHFWYVEGCAYALANGTVYKTPVSICENSYAAFLDFSAFQFVCSTTSAAARVGRRWSLLHILAYICFFSMLWM